MLAFLSPGIKFRYLIGIYSCGLNYFTVLALSTGFHFNSFLLQKERLINYYAAIAKIHGENSTGISLVLHNNELLSSLALFL